MKRTLRKDLKWDAEDLELEFLEWDKKPEDFNRLVEYVVQKINSELKVRALDIYNIVPEVELRGEIMLAARGFKEKYISLPHFVYLHIKSFLICKMKGGKWR